MKNTDCHCGTGGEVASRYHHEWSPETPLSIAVIEAVAAVSDRDPTEIEPLNEYVDPDALDDLFGDRTRNGRLAGTVSFPFEDYLVIVHGSGEIVVHAPD